MHPCPTCHQLTEGTWSEGGIHWAQCADCFAAAGTAGGPAHELIPRQLWRKLCALHGLATEGGHKLYFDEVDAAAARDVAEERCIHGVPINVFCGKCEA